MDKDSTERTKQGPRDCKLKETVFHRALAGKGKDGAVIRHDKVSERAHPFRFMGRGAEELAKEHLVSAGTPPASRQHPHLTPLWASLWR